MAEVISAFVFLAQSGRLWHPTPFARVTSLTEPPPTRVQHDKSRANGDENYQRGVHRRDSFISRHSQLSVGRSATTVPRSQVNVGHTGRRGDLRPCKGCRHNCLANTNNAGPFHTEDLQILTFFYFFICRFMFTRAWLLIKYVHKLPNTQSSDSLTAAHQVVTS